MSRLSDYVNVNAAFDNARGLLEIDQDANLDTTRTIPNYLLLMSTGGRLTLQSGVTITNEAACTGNLQIFIYTPGTGTFYWRAKQNCNASWFGMKQWSDTSLTPQQQRDEGDANVAAWYAAWMASKKYSNLAYGAPMEVSPGYYWFTKFEPSLGETHGDQPVFCNGVKLAAPTGHNDPMFVLRNIGGPFKEASIHGLELDGGSLLGNELANGAFLFNCEGNYNATYDRLRIENVSGNALNLEEAGNVSLYSCEIQKVSQVEPQGSDPYGGIGIQLKGLNACALYSPTTEECEVGVKIIGRYSTSNRYSQVSIDNLYAERTGTCLYLYGARNVTCGAITSDANYEAVRIEYNSEDDQMSCGNYVETLRSGDIVIGEKVRGNQVVFDPTNDQVAVTNLAPDDNQVTQKHTHAFGYDLDQFKGDGQNLVEFSNPADEALSSDMVRTLGTVLENDALTHRTETNGPAHISSTPASSGKQHFIKYPFSGTASTTYYIYLIAQGDENIRIGLDVRDLGGSGMIYDWNNGEFSQSPKDQYCMLPLERTPRMFRVPFTMGSTAYTQLLVRVQIVRTMNPSNATVRYYYKAISQTPDLRITHVRSSNTLGYDGYVELAEPLPPASEVSLGTTVKNTTTGKFQFSDGATWLDL